MRYFFYNSFTLGSGYKYAELKNNVICSTDIPVDIDCDFSNGGCQLVVRKTKARTSILVLKGILYVNSQKRFDEQGRKVYINFAIEASVDELHVLNNLFFAIIAEWKNICRYMGEAVKIPYPNDTYGYGIDQEQIDSLVRFLSAYDTGAVRNKVGADPDRLNAIVLKSSNYSYYESLAEDLYKSKRQSFSGKFVPSNIITGEAFSEWISDAATRDYDEFLQQIGNPVRENPDKAQDNGLRPNAETAAKPEAVPGIGQQAPLQETEPPVQVADDTTKEHGQTALTNTQKHDGQDKGFIQLCGTIYERVIKPHSKFIFGFVCGLIIGYLIWNK